MSKNLALNPRNMTLIFVLILLGYAFWMSKDFKTIAAGVAVFLFGMLFLETGFTAFTGGVLEKFLQKSTDNVFKSLSFGVVSTSLMQSSSLVSVITISFLSAGLIHLAGGIGIIFGANIGTTTGAWLMAGFGMKVKISAYAMPMLVFGLIFNFQKSKELKGIGQILAGMGFLFLGISFMKEGFESFKDTFDLAQFALGGYTGLFLFTGIGVLATVVMQSSHATLMLIIAGLAAGQITYENALALAIGANIGTTITAILGSLSANIAGKRLALAHLIFNVITGLIAIVFIHQLRVAVDVVSDGVGIAPDDWTLKLAVFHSIFNVIGVLVMTPFIAKLVTFLEARLPESTESEIKGTKYLNDAAIYLPDTALRVMYKESQRLFDKAIDIVAPALNLTKDDILSDKPMEEVVRQSKTVNDINIHSAYYRQIKGIYNEIVNFGLRAQTEMTEKQIAEAYVIKLACRNMAQIIKTIEEMKANIDKYMNSENPSIRKEYDLFRTNIAKIIRKTYEIRSYESREEAAKAFDILEGKLEGYDVIYNGSVADLVKKQEISDEMATSLMNDSAYAYDIGKMVIDVGEAIWISDKEDINQVNKIEYDANDNRRNEERKEIWTEEQREAQKRKSLATS